MKALIAGLAAVGLGILAVVIFVTMWVSYNNSATRLGNTIEAKQKDNESQLTKLDAVLGTQGDVLVEQKKAVMEVATKYAAARGSGGGSLMKWVQEALPNLDQSTYKTLMNSITAENTGFAFHQTEILDLQREYNNLCDTFPSSFFVSTLGKHKHMNVVVVTSSDAQKAFKTGTREIKSPFGGNSGSTAEKP